MTKKPDQDGPLASVFAEATRIGAQMKADGASLAERQAFVARALREAWPKGREEPWHYVCSACEDTGWRSMVCVQGSCGRPFRLPGQHDDDHTGQGRCQDGHTYVQPCTCPKGSVRRQQLLKQRSDQDAIEIAAKSKPKGFTRFGR